MMNEDPEASEPVSKDSTPDSQHRFQFGLAPIFIVTTATAILLTCFLAVGRAFGMSTEELVEHLYSRSLTALPRVLVWLVGLTIAIQQRQRVRLGATLAGIAFLGFLLITFVTDLTHMVLLHQLQGNQLSSETASKAFYFTSVFYTISTTGLWILILVALFARRAPALTKTEPTHNRSH